MVLLWVLGILVYSNTFRNDFQLDDFHVITENPAIRTVHPAWRHFADASTMSAREARRSYRPLLPLSLSLTYALHGTAVWGYHLFNLLCHLLAATVLYLVIVRLLVFPARPGAAERIESARALSALAAALFVAHPISGMTVNYLSSRDNLMMQVFLGVALHCYLRLRGDGDRWTLWLAALVSYLAALLTKAPALAFPLVIVLFDLVVARASPKAPATWLRPTAFGLVGAAAAVVEHVMPGRAEQLGPWTAATLPSFAATQIELHLVHYLRNFVYPFEMRGLPSWDAVTSVFDAGMLVSGLVVVGSWGVAWRLRRRSPHVAFAIGAYWGMFAPTSSFFPLAQWVADRWMYPAMPYLCLVAACAMVAVVRVEARPWVLAGALAYLGGASMYMNTHWRTPLRFYEQSARYGTDATGHMNLGLEYLPIDRAKAKGHFERALELAPYYHYAHINLGLWYIGNGETERGLAQVRKGVEYAPPNVQSVARYWLGVALGRAGRHREAVPELRRAYEAEPLQHEKLYEAAFAAYEAGDPRLAAELFERLHAKVANVRVSRFTAGWVAWTQGDVDKAIREYRLAAQHSPEYAQTYLNLGVALKRRGECREAVESFEKYLRLVPGNRAAQEHIAACRGG